MTKINSRTKGKVGELEFAHYLTDHGFEAERGQQHAGGVESPDVKCKGLEDVHFEVKRVQSGNLYKWIEQAIKDAGPGKYHIVAHRKNHKEWLAILPMDDMMRLLILRELYHGTQGGSGAVQKKSKRTRDRQPVRDKPKRTSKTSTVQQLMQGD
jgi:Holliday junction resolvase